MKININIRNLVINLPHQGECERPRKQHSKAGGNYQPSTKETAVDGVYIYTESGNLWVPQFWGLSDETPRSVVVIKGERRLCVSLKGSSSDIILLESKKEQNGKCFSSSDDALSDWDGRKNTEKLFRLGSPTAQFCKSIGDEWYVPALGEFNLLHENKNEVDAALIICGGEPLYFGWNWTSTRQSEKCSWVLNWSNGLRCYSHQSLIYRVRPVSAFL